MGLSSAGIGSNLDVNSIVSQLMAVERQPVTQLDLKTASFQAKLSGFGTLKGVLAGFQSALSGLANGSKFQGAKTAIGDATVASVTGSSAAVPGTYSLEVSQLAQTQKLNALGKSSSTAAIGSGAATTLSFDFGTITGGAIDTTTGKYTGSSFTSAEAGVKTVSIDATNNSLSGIRDAINSAAVGVTATIVNDGSSTPYRLSITVNATGKASSLKLSVNGDASISSLLSHDPSANGGQGLSQTVAAQDANFKLDGIAVTKGTNSVSDALPGVTLNLAKTNLGTPTAITVTRDTATVVSSVSAFVKAFNEINQTLKDATAYNATTKQAAVLNGEASVRSIQTQIRSVLSAPIAGNASTYTLLSQVGVSVQKDGSLGVDSAKLQKAVDTDFDQIAGLFSNVGKTTDALVSFSSAASKTAAGSYAVSISQLATQGVTTGVGAAGLTITAGVNDSIGVSVDGLSSTITLTPGTYASSAALATDLQSKINGSAALAGLKTSITATGGVLSLTSASYGSASRIEITGGNGRANLKFDTGASITDGKNVAGYINGVAGVGTGQILAGATGNAAEGLQLQVNGGAIGSRGTVNYSKGYAYQLNSLATSLLGAGGPIASRTDGINSSLKDIAKNKDVLNARLALTEKRYRAQFTTLDSVISKMSTTSSYLTQQLASLAKNA